MRTSLLWAAALLALALAPAAAAQEPAQRLILDLNLTPGLAFVSRLVDPRLPQSGEFTFVFSDQSIERVAATGSFVQFHQVVPSVTWEGGDLPPGWSTTPVSANPQYITAGNVGKGGFSVYHSASSTQQKVSGALVVRLVNPTTGDFVEKVAPFTVVVAPSPAGSIKLGAGAPEKASPDELVTIPLVIRNLDAYANSYRVSATAIAAEGIDPEEIGFGGTGDYFLQPEESREVQIVFKAPRQQLWYNLVAMTIQLRVSDSKGAGAQTTTTTLIVDGFYVPANIFLLALGTVAQLALLIALLVFARRRYERAFLGRPIPPWTIPAEIANLERLRNEDPRGHYVLRYFLMEEEYRSALLWFDAYKKVSRRQLRAELRAASLQDKANLLSTAPLERHERAFERLQRRYERRIERANARTQKRIDALQRRLDRSFEKDFEADHAKWEAKVEKLRAKHDKPFLKAKQKWDAEAKKALAKWEKPFKKDQEKYERALAKAKEAYAAKVKKADKPTWKEWRLRMEDWEVENKLRKKEGREPAPEPDLLSAAVGAPELPEAFVPPPRPELPPEPQPAPLTELPSEPQLSTPDLASSHYAKDARKVEQEGLATVRALERGLAVKLNEMLEGQGDAKARIESRRRKMLAAATSAPASSFVDRVLRRTPEHADRRHHVAYIKGLTKEHIQELMDAEEATLERIRVEGERKEATLEAKILANRASLSRAKAAGDETARTTESASAKALVRELGELKIHNAKRLAEERKASKVRLDERIARLRAEERDRLAREAAAEKPEGAPTHS